MQIPAITLADVEQAIERKKRNKFYNFFPESGPLSRHNYPKHMQFFLDGAMFRQRLFMAANRAGKTEAGGFEVTCHLTGIYPAWWQGKRFSKAINCLVAGETGKLVRDSIQEKLLGNPSAVGTGMIPYDCIVERRTKSGISNAIDIAKIRHINGDLSTLQFQSYDQGRESFQATERDVILLDEEPPLDVYIEALTRTMTTGGIVLITFTPLKGKSETVQFLEKQHKEGIVSKVVATWDDAPHLSTKDKEEMLSAYPPHQRDARSKGIPSLGSGAIYPVPESDILCAPFQLPVYWPRAYAMDVGWNKTAVLWGAIDHDTDTIYIYNEYYRGQAEPSVHADSIRTRGKWMHGVIDPASRGRAQKDGEQLFRLYQELGLQITKSKNSVEGGIYEVYQRLSTGRLKIFNTCLNFIEEYTSYHRDEKGNVVKENDHLMDCLRYFILSGMTVATHPPAFKDSLIKKSSGHQISYDPLSIKNLNNELAPNHKINYDPLKM